MISLAVTLELFPEELARELEELEELELELLEVTGCEYTQASEMLTVVLLYVVFQSVAKLIYIWQVTLALGVNLVLKVCSPSWTAMVCILATTFQPPPGSNK